MGSRSGRGLYKCKSLLKEANMQKNLDKKHSPTIADLGLRLGLVSRELQATKSDIPREGDIISRLLERGILCFLFLLSIVLRISLYKVVNGDYANYLQPWYYYIQVHGGFAAFKDTFSDYNPPYLYL